eukprot:TRINITY_DN5717_c0_g1_i1.p1 TRINITY_DN5717_c0_g1~~TRINITY_DN5717_c0_g1_i1.p1  ORF type:complete len:479 (-),score=94.29 TRINITY_DN5717_c0_g1_i1:118-1554(-)
MPTTLPFDLQPFALISMLRDEIQCARLLLDQLEIAEEFISWDHESDNQWREDNKKNIVDVDDEEIYSGDDFASKPFDIASVIKVQAQVRGWLARRQVAKAILLLKMQPHVNQIVRAQAFVRGWRQRKQYTELKRILDKRKAVAIELLQSEQAYVDDLRTIVEVYLNPLRKPMSTITPANVKSIFSELEVILNYNALLLKEVETKIQAWCSSQCLGPIFIRLTDFLKVYTQYVNNFPKALTTLNACKQKATFKAFLTECRTNKRVADKDLISQLQMPIQRIPHYVSHLTDLLNYTPEEHQDYANLKIAVAKVKEVTEYVGKKKEVAENIQKVLKVQDKLVGKNAEVQNLAQPSRRYICKGPLMTVKGSDKRNTTAYYFMFNDLLVATKKQKAKNKKGKKKSIYKFLHTVAFTPKTVVKTCPETVYTVPNSFQLINTTKQYTFACESQEERQSWVDNFGDAINQLIDHQRSINERLAETK